MTKLPGPPNETTSTLIQLKTGLPLALCWHYCSTHFEGQQVRVLAADGGSRELTVTWAVGMLADGDWEALGAWPQAAAGLAFWRGVWEDLDSRGVDKISLVDASDLDARSLCPGAKVLPTFQRVLGQRFVPAASGVGVLRAEARRLVREASGVRAARVALERLLLRSGVDQALVLSPDWPAVLEQLRPFYALRPHRRAVVRQGDEHLEQLDLRVRRAVARHGPFADLPSATQFVAWTLSREQMQVRFPHWPAHWVQQAQRAVGGFGAARMASAGI